MKLVFICGSLERGRDGVGDYTRILASEIVGRGHSCVLIAFNDRYIQKSNSGHLAGHEYEELEVYRFASSIPLSARFCLLKQLLLALKPDWISLQFVPYSFSDKGISFRFVRKLCLCLKGKKVHIMFHELWIGIDAGSKPLHRVIGFLQRLTVKLLLKNAVPSAMSTQCDLYLHLLAGLGYSASILPLFSNIAPSREKLITQPVAPTLRFVVFGNIHEDAPVEDFVAACQDITLRHGTAMEIIFSGRSGSCLEYWTNVCSKGGMKCQVLGEQSTEMISYYLHSASFGIATTPTTLLQKSGAVAAMLCHRIPVINLAPVWEPRCSTVCAIPKGVMIFNKDSIFDILTAKWDDDDFSIHDVGEVAQSFINQLSH